MLAVAFLTGVTLAQRAVKRKGIDPDTIADVGLWLLISGVLGARIMFMILNPRLFPISQPINFLKIWEGGLVFYGGVIAALPVGVLVLRRKKADVWHLADVLAPFMALAHGIGRIGCFLNGCCYGKPSNVPWAISFPKFVDETGLVTGSPVYLYQLDRSLITADAARSLPVHPTQIYAVLGLFAISAILLLLWKRRAFKGQIFWSYLVLYSLFRFGNEFLRADNAPVLFGLTISQLIGVPVLLLGSAVLIRGTLVSRGEKKGDSVSPAESQESG
jgi:phosphatidylglycerol:prolipoprotein diacylglycerol transferase